MKEIRQVYVAQKKKEVRDHFILVGIATVLLGLLAVVTEYLDRFKKEVPNIIDES